MITYCKRNGKIQSRVSQSQTKFLKFLSFSVHFCCYYCNKEMEPLNVTTSLKKRLEELEYENKRLREENRDIKEFLKDYGMIWVGQRRDGIDHETFLKKLQKLNETAVEQQRLVVQQTLSGAKLSYPDSVPLCVYKDALEVGGTKRSYADPEARKFVRDVMDGYYPLEFKEKYPDGVVFDITDKHNIIIDSCEPRKDQRVSKNEKEDNEKIRSIILAETGLLVRRKKINQSINIARTSLVCELENNDRPTLPKDATILVIRFFDGDRRLILAFSSKDFVRVIDVHKWIEKEWSLKNGTYSLRSSFPSRHYDDDTKMTLSECGLCGKVNRLMLSRKGKAHNAAV